MTTITQKSVVIILIHSVMIKAFSQVTDTSKPKWTNHFEFTYIAQKHAAFHSKYSGENSLADSVEPAEKSITATLFWGRKVWKGAAFYFNPEVSGGNGLSFTKGVAGALNGETYRVGDVAPSVLLPGFIFSKPLLLRALLMKM